jgi:hypothetical protein
MNVPIIRFEIEGMKHTLQVALSQYAAVMDEQMQEAVEASCTVENLQRIIEKSAKQEIECAINEEIRKFYSYGKGREAIRNAVQLELNQRGQPDTTESGK